MEGLAVVGTLLVLTVVADWVNGAIWRYVSMRMSPARQRAGDTRG
jgi:hypothetical protein